MWTPQEVIQAEWWSLKWIISCNNVFSLTHLFWLSTDRIDAWLLSHHSVAANILWAFNIFCFTTLKPSMWWLSARAPHIENMLKVSKITCQISFLFVEHLVSQWPENYCMFIYSDMCWGKNRIQDLCWVVTKRLQRQSLNLHPLTTDKNKHLVYMSDEK